MLNHKRLRGFPAHSIESQLQMVIRAKMDGHWVAVGETPGTVDVPACDDLELYLGLVA